MLDYYWIKKKSKEITFRISTKSNTIMQVYSVQLTKTPVLPTLYLISIK